MARIAIGGWQHETNTFATKKAGYSDFQRADEWPALSVGDALFENTRGVHLPVTGAIDLLSANGHELVPLLWCSATPCSYVTEDAFERISAQFLDLLQRSLPVDGIYLDLHGAMVCAHLEDGEGEFLRRVREQVGNDMPIAVSLDLHANVTPEMVQHATVIDIFRTYPHIDMGETGARVAGMLERLIAKEITVVPAFRQPEFLIALNFGCSLIEPCESLYAQMPNLINSKVPSISFACGFHLSDIHHVGPSIVAYGVNQELADKAADAMLKRVADKQAEFGQKIWEAEEGVLEAIRLSAPHDATVVLADTQDNPGGGGSGDTTGLLQALIRAKAENSVFGVLADPETVNAAITAGISGAFEAALGGRSGLEGQAPFPCTCKVLGLFDGNFVATGPMYKGAHMTLGSCALVETGGVKVAISSYPVQTADQSIFRHFGIEPASMSIIGLKSSVHFRNDFTELADHILVVTAPGAVFADPSTLNYQNKRADILCR